MNRVLLHDQGLRPVKLLFTAKVCTCRPVSGSRVCVVSRGSGWVGVGVSQCGREGEVGDKSGSVR